jgi:DNA modification methylase
MQHKKPLAYKPNCVTEYIMVYRKKTSKLIDWNIKQYDSNIIKSSLVPNGYERTNVWKINPSRSKIHPAIFPKELCKKVIQYYSYIGDTILDPFGGIGTVADCSIELNRNFVICEKNENYFDYMKNNKLGSDIKFIKNNEI